MAALIAVVYSFVVTAIIAYALKATMGWRVAEDVETIGIDSAVHGESAYEGLGSGLAATLPPREAAPTTISSSEEKVGS